MGLHRVCVSQTLALSIRAASGTMRKARSPGNGVGPWSDSEFTLQPGSPWAALKHHRHPNVLLCPWACHPAPCQPTALLFSYMGLGRGVGCPHPAPLASTPRELPACQKPDSTSESGGWRHGGGSVSPPERDPSEAVPTASHWP